MSCIHLSSFIRLLACIALAMVAVPMHAQSLPLPVAEAMRSAQLPDAALGVYVQEVNAAEPMLAFNADIAYSPASTMKLVTTHAALELLGPAFRWKTQAYFHGTHAGDVLHGDLIIRGGGDPKLVTEDFWLFLRQIRQRGIRDIRGNVILDRSLFELPEHDADRFDGDAAKPYNVGADALLLNYASFRFRFVPNPLLKSVTVLMDPPFATFPLAAPRLVAGECGDWQRKLGPAFAAGVTFAGTYAAACGEKTWYMAPHHLTPNQYFGGLFRQMWQDLGGMFQGEIRSGITPPDAALITERESPPLPEIIRDINKFSNNVMARQVLLTVAASAQPLPANAERGAQLIRQWLTAKRIDAPEMVIDNGSGLSREERIAPRTMGRILIAAFRSPTMPEFMSSMPLAGLDGTMRNRLRDKGVTGHAHIKTGRLDDVRAVAGYVLAASGKRYAVVCIVNHPNPGAGPEVHDALLQWIYENG